ncbi:aminoglycoside phosphotransferase family protein [Priestia megaterium]|uniref:phosphotransferase family protein n=1 Tax=Priestia TaxID=2800373 RepID=UPI00211D44DC|nr:aminoglycoside phosphotransferase family protein [Priestia megaterium]MED3855067.1 aminoglycoside phosphotransferase family protein [Priestia megaterium]MED4796302.1 aminoglycoside phosphotransferase family protein [Priestia megaterium]
MTFPKQGCTSDAGILHTAKGRYVLKRAKGEKYRKWLYREYYVLKYIQALEDFQSPRAYKFVQTAEQSRLLLEFFEGKTVREYLEKEDNEKKREHVVYEMGRLLARIHDAECPEPLVSKQPWVHRMLQEAQYNLIHYKVDGNQQLLKQLQKQNMICRKEVLIHGDYTIDNVLVHDGRITAVIDWSGGTCGDARYDMALAVRFEDGIFTGKDSVFF